MRRKKKEWKRERERKTEKERVSKIICSLKFRANYTRRGKQIETIWQIEINRTDYTFTSIIIVLVTNEDKKVQLKNIGQLFYLNVYCGCCVLWTSSRNCLNKSIFFGQDSSKYTWKIILRITLLKTEQSIILHLSSIRLTKKHFSYLELNYVIIKIIYFNIKQN